MLTQSPRGTLDILPAQSHAWHYVEERIRAACALSGYREIRTPVFEHTELFLRGVGDTTDVVQKEMYTFEDRGGRSVTLKPEGTAGAARAFIEHGLAQGPLPLKMYYLYCPVLRYESPQSGRYREHHQFGLEAFGAPEATMDAEIIALPWKLFQRLGLSDLTLKVNSIGCPKCRPGYQQALRDFLTPLLPDMCGTCRERFTRNPLRILDCKVPTCGELTKDAPAPVDYLCAGCADHFAKTREALAALGIQAELDNRLVRGLDYYTRTVFEIHAMFENGPLAMVAGGRYDGLVEQLGGPPTAGIGYGMGMERLVLQLQKQGLIPEAGDTVTAYVAVLGQGARLPAQKLCYALREAGVSADCDHTGRSLKSQMKYADKLGAPYVLVLGEDEVAAGTVNVRFMRESREETISQSAAVDLLSNLTPKETFK